jgi:hypothetical protein
VTSPRSNFATSLDSKLSSSFGDRFNHFEQLAELDSEDMTVDKGDNDDEELLFNVYEPPAPREAPRPLVAYTRMELLNMSRSKLVGTPKDMASFDLWFG